MPLWVEINAVVVRIPSHVVILVDKAGQDNNHLQKVVNVHESAFTWVRRYKTSNSASERRRLRDLLLPGSSAVFTAIPSSPRMRVGHEAYDFAFGSSSDCLHCCARGIARQQTSWCSK